MNCYTSLLQSRFAIDSKLYVFSFPYNIPCGLIYYAVLLIVCVDDNMEPVNDPVTEKDGGIKT